MHSTFHWLGMEFDLWIIFMSWIVMAFLIAISWLASRRLNWIPQGWQNVMEIVVDFIMVTIKDNLGKKGIKYSYFFGSLFLFILVANMLGLIPGMASPTRDVSVTLSLAILVAIWMQYIGFRENGIKHLKHFFTPNFLFFPLHFLELFTRPLTLALRLFGNIFAGEILISVLTRLTYFVIPSIFIGLGIFIGMIQAYIFTLLSVAYTGLSVSDHEENAH